MENTNHTSLREVTLSSIGDFLYTEKFNSDEITKFGILEIINLISDYYEEGNKLFPEVLITNNLDFFDTIPNKELLIKEGPLTINEFKTAIKLCAPLAVNNWIIFIEVKDEMIKYGITSAEMQETSPSIYNQTVGELKVEYKNTTIAYLRNIGQKVVELCGLRKRLIISLNLEEPKNYSLNEIHQLSQSIASRCNETIKVNLKTFFEKLIDETLKVGHGNLIGIVDDTEDNLAKITDDLKVNGGVFLQEPIDFQMYISESESNKDSESSINLKAYASVLRAMLNHDGITIITNKARVIAYHLLIDAYPTQKEDIIDGGARSKAYLSMKNCELFEFCFYKSQDGNVKIWKK